MASPLHSARCLARNNKYVDVELQTTTAIDAHFPLSHFFAAALLHESACVTLYRSPGVPWSSPARSPLAALATEGEVADFACGPQTDAARMAFERNVVHRCAYRSTRNWTPQLFTLDAAGDFSAKSLASNDPLRSAAHRALVALEQAARKATRGSASSYASLGPAATLRIEVLRPELCAHLEPGMLWDVYAFDESMELFA